MSVYLCVYGQDPNTGVNTIFANQTITDSLGFWVAMPLGLEGCAILNTIGDPSDQSPLFTFGDFGAPLADADVSNYQSFASQFNIPSSAVSTSMTFGQLARFVGQIAQVLQRAAAQSGGAIFSNTTYTGLAANAQTIQTGGTAIATLQSVATGVGAGSGGSKPTLPTLSTALSSVSNVATVLATAAESFNFDSSVLDPNADLETNLVAIATQWTAPLILNRGDGLQF